jgi:hypothetical protein
VPGMKTIVMKWISRRSVAAATALTGMGALILLLTQPRAEACGDYTSLHQSKSLEQFAREAVSENQAVASNAVAHLRAAAQRGLDALFRVHEQEIAALRAPLPAERSEQADADRGRLKAAIEAVSQQRDCAASKLFWYTDLEQAKAAAVAAGNKPILSLRLLGKLNEEYSCANSRFFRTTLYANEQVSTYLRDHFILHWQSVRPVPRITVDFGDGRRIERTITGNSIHYVLDATGRVVDALPGLYGARTFLAGLQNAEAIARQTDNLNDAARVAALRIYHTESEKQIQAAFWRDLNNPQVKSPGPLLSQIGLDDRPLKLDLPHSNSASVRTPTAIQAGTRAMAKTAIESPLLRPGTRPGPGGAPGSERIENNIGDETWLRIAALHADDAALDQGARTLIRIKSPDARKAALAARGKGLVEDPLLRSLRNLERSIAEDTVRNEYTMHTKIHEWLAKDPSPELGNLNSRVYAQLFLTPDSDPWLGLAPADTYSALDGDGLVTSADFGVRSATSAGVRNAE